MINDVKGFVHELLRSELVRRWRLRFGGVCHVSQLIQIVPGTMGGGILFSTKSQFSNELTNHAWPHNLSGVFRNPFHASVSKTKQRWRCWKTLFVVRGLFWNETIRRVTNNFYNPYISLPILYKLQELIVLLWNGSLVS